MQKILDNLWLPLAIAMLATGALLLRKRDDPQIEFERLSEAKQLTISGWHVARRVEQIDTSQPSPPRSTPTISIAAETSKTGSRSIKMNLLGSRTEKGNLIITGDAWAVGDKGQKLFGGQFERVEALEAIVEQPKRKSWAVGPAASFGPNGWMFGASVASPSVKVLFWEPRVLGTITTNGRKAQGVVSVLFEL
jgi:hypothetical protein